MGFWSSLLGLNSSPAATQANIITNSIAGQVRDNTFKEGNQNIQAGAGTLGEAGSTAASAGKDYKAAANGSMEDLQKMYNPQISTVMSQYDNAAKQASSMGPRGGGRTGMMAELPFKKAAAAGGIISQARAAAPAGEVNAAQTQGGIGQAMGALGTSEVNGGLGTLAAAEGPVMQSEGQVAGNYGALGKLIGTIATGALTGS